MTQTVLTPTGPRSRGPSIYAAKGEREVSWFQDDAQPSLALIEEVASPSSAVIDIGGGASRLADVLLEQGFLDLTILDLSSAALAAAKERIGGEAERIQWIVADITTWGPSRAYDIWQRSTLWLPSLTARPISPGWRARSSLAGTRSSRLSLQMVRNSAAACL